MTQCERIMAYIDTYGSITTMEAFMDLGIARLASRICDLTKRGVEFDRKMETRRNRYGEKVKYMRYARKENKDDNRRKA